MKKLTYSLSLIILFFACAAISATEKSTNTAAPVLTLAGDEYVVDLRNSRINWNIKTSRGANNGELLIKSGKVNEEKNRVKNADILIDMTAIMIRSIPPGIVNMKAVTILNTESFFDVGRYPTARIEISKCIQKSQTTFEAIGFLTIKGRRQSIRFDMEGGFNYGHFEARAKNIVVNRALYDIRYTSDESIDKEFDTRVEDAIDDSFTIDVFIVADKESDENKN